MLDQGERNAILELRRRGASVRGIARAMGVSRNVVRKVLRAHSATVPPRSHPSKAEPFRDRILELHAQCKGNLIRVHEELGREGSALSYPALTAFCRNHGIGQEPKVAVGQYHFKPGEEMQHDTSPHQAWIGDRLRPVQTASLVLCYSRMLFFQFSATFRRFDCKIFLTEAFAYMGGACEVCMIDNTHVIVLRGTGRDMVPVPEMEAFAERYRMKIRAHEKGDANRSAHVEKSFDYIENNFLAGRRFRDWDDANAQAREWCDKVNAGYKRHLKASPRDLYATERGYLRPLPLWVPPVYLLHQRIVDLEGYVTVNTNRYSLPEDFIGRRLEVRETRASIEIYDGPRLIATHARIVDPSNQRSTLPEHRRARNRSPRRVEVVFEEQALVTRAPEIAEYAALIKKRAAGRGTLALRRLLRLVDEYPREPLVAAVRTAQEYGLFDLDRLENMVIRRVAQEYFELDLPARPDGEDDEEG
jgi:transposase